MTLENQHSLAILKSSEDSLQNLESFLKGREWQIFSTTDLKKVITKLVTAPPEYILICANHPSKKLKVLMNLIQQATNVKIVAYCDQSTIVSVTKLRELNCRYELMPPVSGPSLLRMIHKIGTDDDELKRSSQKKHQIVGQTGATSAEGNTSAFLSSGTSPSSQSGSSILAALLKIAEEEPSNPMISGHNTVESTAKADTDSEPNFPTNFQEYEEQKNQEKKANFASILKSDKAPDREDLHRPSLNAEGHISAPIPAKKTFIGKKSAFTNDSILVRGVNQVLDSSVQTKAPPPPEPTFNYSPRSYCVIIQVQRFQGYLVASFSDDNEINLALIEKIREELFQYLRANGEVSREEIGTLPITLREMNFENWAFNYGDFMRKTFHQSQQVTLAFFASEQILPEFTESHRKDMVKIEIENINCDVVMSFDLYLYLPANDKFVLYTPKGGVFSKIQKDRLIEKKVKHIHLRKEDEDASRAHCAETFLNETVKKR